MQRKTSLRWGLLAILAIGAGATGAGLAAADTAAPDTPPVEDGSDSDTARMQRMLETMPPDVRESAEQMHEQMRPMMEQMMSSMDEMGDMGRMGDKDMGGMMGN